MTVENSKAYYLTGILKFSHLLIMALIKVLNLDKRYFGILTNINSVLLVFFYFFLWIVVPEKIVVSFNFQHLTIKNFVFVDNLHLIGFQLLLGKNFLQLPLGIFRIITFWTPVYPNGSYVITLVCGLSVRQSLSISETAH